jgi:hypothetical protein
MKCSLIELSKNRKGYWELGISNWKPACITFAEASAEQGRQAGRFFA